MGEAKADPARHRLTPSIPPSLRRLPTPQRSPSGAGLTIDYTSDDNINNGDLAKDVARGKELGDWEKVARKILRVDARTADTVLGMVLWKDGTESWHPMKDLKQNCPQMVGGTGRPWLFPISPVR